MNIEHNLEEIKKLPPEEAIIVLDHLIGEEPGNDEALTLRGLKYWAKGERQLAINDYLAALQINPSSNAAMALEYANRIMAYYNKDLLNP